MFNLLKLKFFIFLILKSIKLINEKLIILKSLEIKFNSENGIWIKIVYIKIKSGKNKVFLNINLLSLL